MGQFVARPMPSRLMGDGQSDTTADNSLINAD